MATRSWVNMANGLLPFLGLLFASRAVSAPTDWGSVTISGPGVSDHGKPGMICLPTKATDVLLFFLANYFAHAATVKLLPGVPTVEVCSRILVSLLFPVNSISHALEAIFNWSWKLSPRFPFLRMETDSLDTALNAGALVVAMRNPFWKPAPTDTKLRDLRRAKVKVGLVPTATRAAEGWTGKGGDNPAVSSTADNATESGNTLTPRTVYKYTVRSLDDYPDGDGDRLVFGMPNIHGGFKLPEGYGWVRLLPETKIRPYGRPINEDQPTSSGIPEARLTSTFSVAQPVIAIFQTVNAAWTLYKTRGDQLDQFGFAAFGLTVTPYLMMSILNFLAQLATPQYASAYIVYSEVLAEAAARVGNPPIFGIVGEVIPDSSASSEDTFMEGWVSETKGELTIVLDQQQEEQEGQQQPNSVVVDVSNNQDNEASPTPESKNEAGSSAQGIPEPSSTRQGSNKAVEEEEFWLPYHPRFELRKPQEGSFLRHFREHKEITALTVSVVFACIPVAIIGAISRFEAGQSTQAQRGVMIAWMISSAVSQVVMYGGFILVVVVVYFCAGFVYGMRGKELPYTPQDAENLIVRSYGVLLVLGSSISLAMFVTVGQELLQYGSCQFVD